MSSWEIEYYETAAGSVPVTEFVEDVAPQAQAKFIRSLELLEEYGLLLRNPVDEEHPRDSETQR